MVEKRRLPRRQRGIPEDWVTIDGEDFHPQVAQHVATIRDRIPGLRIVDGHRDERENRDSQGLENSWHRFGRAVDFQGTARQMKDAEQMAKALGATEVLVNHPVGIGQVVHVAWQGGPDERPI